MVDGARARVLKLPPEKKAALLVAFAILNSERKDLFVVLSATPLRAQCQNDIYKEKEKKRKEGTSIHIDLSLTAAGKRVHEENGAVGRDGKHFLNGAPCILDVFIVQVKISVVE